MDEIVKKQLYNGSDRIAKWDNLKAVLIFCVVFGHLRFFFEESSLIMSCGYFWENIFNMPAFVFVTGLLSKKTINDRRYYKIFPFLLLYLIMKTFNYFARVFVNGGTEGVPFSFFQENEVPWFAIAVFWWYLITIGLSKVKPGYVIIVSVLVSAISGYSEDVSSLLAMNRTIVFFPFFYAGYLLDSRGIIRRLNSWWVVAFSWVIIVGSLFITLRFNEKVLPWGNMFRGRFNYSEIDVGFDIVWGGVWRICIYAISVIVAASIIAVVPNRPIVLISGIGRKTLAIYSLHIPVFIVLLSDDYLVKAWMVSGHIAWHCMIIALLTVLFLSIPVFEYLLRKVMTVPIGEKLLCLNRG